MKSIKFLLPLLSLYLTPSLLLATPNCDNPPVYDCKDAQGKIQGAAVSNASDCPCGTTASKRSGTNQFLLAGGSAYRDIADLSIPAHNHGGEPLSFTRRSVTRYFNVEASSPAGSPGSMGSGGNWRHNW